MPPRHSTHRVRTAGLQSAASPCPRSAAPCAPRLVSATAGRSSRPSDPASGYMFSGRSTGSLLDLESPRKPRRAPNNGSDDLFYDGYSDDDLPTDRNAKFRQGRQQVYSREHQRSHGRGRGRGRGGRRRDDMDPIEDRSASRSARGSPDVPRQRSIEPQVDGASMWDLDTEDDWILQQEAQQRTQLPGQLQDVAQSSRHGGRESGSNEEPPHSRRRGASDGRGRGAGRRGRRASSSCWDRGNRAGSGSGSDGEWWEREGGPASVRGDHRYSRSDDEEGPRQARARSVQHGGRRSAWNRDGASDDGAYSDWDSEGSGGEDSGNHNRSRRRRPRAYDSHSSGSDDESSGRRRRRAGGHQKPNGQAGSAALNFDSPDTRLGWQAPLGAWTLRANGSERHSRQQWYSAQGEGPDFSSYYSADHDHGGAGSSGDSVSAGAFSDSSFDDLFDWLLPSDADRGSPPGAALGDGRTGPRPRGDSLPRDMAADPAEMVPDTEDWWGEVGGDVPRGPLDDAASDAPGPRRAQNASRAAADGGASDAQGSASASRFESLGGDDWMLDDVLADLVRDTDRQLFDDQAGFSGRGSRGGDYAGAVGALPAGGEDGDIDDVLADLDSLLSDVAGNDGTNDGHGGSGGDPLLRDTRRAPRAAQQRADVGSVDLHEDYESLWGDDLSPEPLRGRGAAQGGGVAGPAAGLGIAADPDQDERRSPTARPAQRPDASAGNSAARAPQRHAAASRTYLSDNDRWSDDDDDDFVSVFDEFEPEDSDDEDEERLPRREDSLGSLAASEAITRSLPSAPRAASRAGASIGDGDGDAGARSDPAPAEYSDAPKLTSARGTSTDARGDAVAVADTPPWARSQDFMLMSSGDSLAFEREATDESASESEGEEETYEGAAAAAADAFVRVPAVTVGGRVFHNEFDLTQHFRTYSTDYGASVGPDKSERSPALPAAIRDEVVDLLKKGHNDADAKIGPGVAEVYVGQHPEHDSVCFMLRRVDGTEVDFSYRKCCMSLFTGNWAYDGRPLPRALRKDAYKIFKTIHHRKAEDAENADPRTRAAADRERSPLTSGRDCQWGVATPDGGRWESSLETDPFPRLKEITEAILHMLETSTMSSTLSCAAITVFTRNLYQFPGAVPESLTPLQERWVSACAEWVRDNPEELHAEDVLALLSCVTCIEPWPLDLSVDLLLSACNNRSGPLRSSVHRSGFLKNDAPVLLKIMYRFSEHREAAARVLADSWKLVKSSEDVSNIKFYAIVNTVHQLDMYYMLQNPNVSGMEEVRDLVECAERRYVLDHFWSKLPSNLEDTDDELLQRVRQRAFRIARSRSLPVDEIDRALVKVMDVGEASGDVSFMPSLWREACYLPSPALLRRWLDCIEPHVPMLTASQASVIVNDLAFLGVLPASREHGIGFMMLLIRQAIRQEPSVQQVHMLLRSMCLLGLYNDTFVELWSEVRKDLKDMFRNVTLNNVYQWPLEGPPHPLMLTANVAFQVVMAARLLGGLDIHMPPHAFKIASATWTRLIRDTHRSGLHHFVHTACLSLRLTTAAEFRVGHMLCSVDLALLPRMPPHVLEMLDVYPTAALSVLNAVPDADAVLLDAWERYTAKAQPFPDGTVRVPLSALELEPDAALLLFRAFATEAEALYKRLIDALREQAQQASDGSSAGAGNDTADDGAAPVDGGELREGTSDSEGCSAPCVAVDDAMWRDISSVGPVAFSQSKLHQHNAGRLLLMGHLPASGSVERELDRPEAAADRSADETLARSLSGGGLTHQQREAQNRLFSGHPAPQRPPTSSSKPWHEVHQWAVQDVGGDTYHMLIDLVPTETESAYHCKLAPRSPDTARSPAHLLWCKMLMDLDRCCEPEAAAVSPRARALARVILFGRYLHEDMEMVSEDAGVPKVALEAHGPLHYTRNVRTTLGATLLRHRLLQHMGWTVIPVEGSGFMSARWGREEAGASDTELEREGKSEGEASAGASNEARSAEYLQKLLEAHGVPLHAYRHADSDDDDEDDCSSSDSSS